MLSILSPSVKWERVVALQGFKTKYQTPWSLIIVASIKLQVHYLIWLLSIRNCVRTETMWIWQSSTNDRTQLIVIPSSPIKYSWKCLNSKCIVTNIYRSGVKDVFLWFLVGLLLLQVLRGTRLTCGPLYCIPGVFVGSTVPGPDPFSMFDFSLSYELVSDNIKSVNGTKHKNGKYSSVFIFYYYDL